MITESTCQQNLRWKKILLIKPNFRVNNADYHFIHMVLSPLSLTYLASYLVDLDVKLEILDTKVKNLNYKQIKKKIEKYKPDIVGISVIVSAAINICYDIAKMAKDINKNCIVVLGGRHPSILTEETLKVNEVDIVVRGEGELTFRELIIKGTPDDIKGISYKSNGKIIHNPDRAVIKDLGNLRYPARQFTKNNKYKLLSVRTEIVETSRGCPYNCKFCTTPHFSNGLWRPLPIEKIITELKMISQNRKISDILFVDDNFTADTKRIEKLCDRIIECKKNKKINDFKFIAQVRVDSLAKSPQMVKKMAEAGFCVVFIGIESINEKTLKDLRKGFEFNKVLKALKVIHKYNIIAIGNIIIGVDLNATEEEIRKKINFMKKIDIDILSFSVLTPFPGTDTMKELEEKNLIITKDWSLYSTNYPVIKTNKLSPKKLRKLLYYSLKKYTFIKNRKKYFPRLVKTRGILFFLNPIRFGSFVLSFIKIKILVKKFYDGDK